MTYIYIMKSKNDSGEESTKIRERNIPIFPTKYKLKPFTDL